jgi:SpoVK/Ycf46/Vps4 family AAA+-type ATPase
MIDITTYRKMHPDAPIFKRRLTNDLGTEAMEKSEPPGDNFLLLLPPNVYGFNILEKKWGEFHISFGQEALQANSDITVNLLVEYTSSVSWNKEAFDTLAVDDETKTLIRALVTNKIAAEKSTDLMSGKGNGLIVLLHGGPGTGKTLTAESVAEMAEKPLYRVTCGDIGTNPEDVEKYLTIVLYLGKIWDCVVLLDEAEVFLQERNLQDLQRNALVSVFLRVLEYYEGILILTSNRVGTFDEAFKSRVQLALHYEPLKESQRRRIWENFVKRLKSLNADEIDIGDLHEHLDDLAKYNMNGREIRNAVTTARQLAMYEKKPMDFKALKHVINVSSRFDRYLKSVNEGMTDEELAREDGLR